MNIKIVYHSITGNTRKIAEIIADELGAKAEMISDNMAIQKIDVLFLGDGNYVSTIHNKTKRFIDGLKLENVKNVAIFGTYGGMNNALPKMKVFLQKKGFNVLDECFSCRGQAWGIISIKHPDETDLKAARNFARNIIERIVS